MLKISDFMSFSPAALLSFSVLIASLISAGLGLIVIIFLLVAVLLSSKRDSLVCAELLIASKCSFLLQT